MVARAKLHWRNTLDKKRISGPPSRIEPLEGRTLLSTSWPTVDSYAATNQDNAAEAMTADAAGNVYAVGTSNQDGVIREKVAGSTSWTQILYLPNDPLFSITVDAKGDVYAGGQESNAHWMVVERPAGQSNFTVVDDSSATYGHCNALTTDSQGNVYAAGFLSVPSTKGNTTTYTRYWVVRKQAGGAGPFMTVDQFDVTSGISMDSSSSAHPSGITNIASGTSAGLYVVGDEAGKWVVRKSTDSGNTWTTVDPGYVYDPSNPASAGAHAVVGDGLGNVYVAGFGQARILTGYSGKGNKTPVYSTILHWIVRKSSNGGASWTVNDDYVFPTPGPAVASALAADAAGNVYVAGYGRDSNNTDHALVRANTGTDANGIPNGSWVTLADNTGATPYGADNHGFTVDSSGTLYTCGYDVSSDASLDGIWVVRSPAPAAPTAAPASAPSTFSTTAIASSSNSADQTVQVYAPHTHGIGEATADWWQWALAFSNDNPNPFTDPTGALAGLNQSGHVFLMPGVSGFSSATRTIQVPAGEPILVPLVVTELSTLEGAGNTPTQVRSADKSFADLIDSLHASIDGVAVPDLFSHREVSPTFHFVAAPNNPIGDPSGNSGIAEADGYWLMLAPMSAGTHIINAGGGVSAFGVTFDVTTTVVVTDAYPMQNAPLAVATSNSSSSDSGTSWLKTSDDLRLP